MGQKVHPYGFRLGFNKTWRSRWYAEKKYAELLHEDLKLRDNLKKRLGHAGVSGIEMATLLLALLVCWLLGWGIVRTRVGRRVKQWVEETFLKRTPVYQTYRRVAGDAAETPTTPGVQPALVQVAGDWQPGVVVEERDEGWATVFVPDIPAAASGRLYCVQAAQIRPLACSLDDFRKTVTAAGRGSRDWLRTLVEPSSP